MYPESRGDAFFHFTESLFPFSESRHRLCNALQTATIEPQEDLFLPVALWIGLN